MTREERCAPAHQRCHCYYPAQVTIAPAFPAITTGGLHIQEDPSPHFFKSSPRLKNIYVILNGPNMLQATIMALGDFLSILERPNAATSEDLYLA